MLLVTNMVGLLLSVLLISFNAGKFRSSIYLGVFFLLTSIVGVFMNIFSYSKSIPLLAITYLNFGPVLFLNGPVLYIYIRSVLSDDSRLKKRDLLHLLPACINLIVLLPYLLTPWSVKLQVAAGIVNNRANLLIPHDTLFFKILVSEYTLAGRPVQVLVYIACSIIMTIRFIKAKKSSQVFSRQQYMIKWISLFLGFLFILTFSLTLILILSFTSLGVKLFITVNFLQLAFLVGMSGLMITPFFFPGILYGLPRISGNFDTRVAFPDAPLLPSQQVIKKNEHDYEVEYLELIRTKVDSCMEELKPYLQPDCNLTTLSKLINIPLHHLAYYFREVKKQPFNDYRNNWRVNHAKALIREGKTAHLTLEAIGIAAGFSTRQTFINAFKKREGMLPSDYSSSL